MKTTFDAVSKISSFGLQIIKDAEGCRLQAYQDAVGVWTIGWGHTGRDVVPGQVITQEMADKALENDTAYYATAVENLLSTPAIQNEFDALVSFTYNVGVKAFANSTLRHMFNAGARTPAALQFLEWIFAGPTILQGLVRRRAREMALFLGYPL